ncbi:MAG: DNA polymerase III subunit alpha, partial [Planctomycetaceae bacterium]|nr:DNA polymerase III subunit alpha [Planctomycetaceae bacterium]
MSSQPFVHLHCHSQYSMLDGANRLGDLITKVKDCDMNAVAVTDHGNLYGAFEFYNMAKANDIKPIVGYEAYIAPGARSDRSASRMKEASFHLTLLAMNRTGYFNLIKLASQAYLEGFYYRPRIDKEILEKHSEGLICLSGCAAGELSQLFLKEKWDEARKLTEWYMKVFDDRFYMEIQNCGLEIQEYCAKHTIEFANEMGLPLVATNDAHYLNKEDSAAHDILLCVSTRATRSDEKRMRMESNEFFVRTPEEMYAAFPGHEEAVAITQEIADRVNIELEENPQHYPVFTPPNNLTDTEYLRKLCLERMESRYGDEATQAHYDRLDFELCVIEKMGYSSYFLIVWDFVRFSEEKKIPCQARGSACGAIVAYLLGLSNVCPLKYDLLFERFLDPSRSEPPDIDIDFCRDRRQ